MMPTKKLKACWKWLNVIWSEKSLNREIYLSWDTPLEDLLGRSGFTNTTRQAINNGKLLGKYWWGLPLNVNTSQFRKMDLQRLTLAIQFSQSLEKWTVSWDSVALLSSSITLHSSPTNFLSPWSKVLTTLNLAGHHIQTTSGATIFKDRLQRNWDGQLFPIRSHHFYSRLLPKAHPFKQLEKSSLNPSLKQWSWKDMLRWSHHATQTPCKIQTIPNVSEDPHSFQLTLLTLWQTLPILRDQTPPCHVMTISILCSVPSTLDTTHSSSENATTLMSHTNAIFGEQQSLKTSTTRSMTSQNFKSSKSLPSNKNPNYFRGSRSEWLQASRTSISKKLMCKVTGALRLINSPSTGLLTIQAQEPKRDTPNTAQKYRWATTSPSATACSGWCLPWSTQRVTPSWSHPQLTSQR